MKLRLAVTFVLAFGMFFTGAGAALGVVEVAQNTALEEQYPVEDPRDPGDPGEKLSSRSESSGGDPQTADQQSASGDPKNLAFTGFLAVPVLVGGIALLGGGMALRRRL